MIKLGSGLLNAIYPIGSIYMSVNNLNPSTIFGGVWEQMAKGRTLVGVDSNDNDFNIVGKMGGSKELESHQHLQYWSSEDGNRNPLVLNQKYGKPSDSTYGAYIHGQDDYYEGAPLLTGFAGNGTSGNLQPYVCVYIWKRTA